jgi:molybdate transport system substrate-binding protein
VRRSDEVGAGRLAPAFERSTGHRAVITYGTAGVLRDKVRNGEAFDAALLPTPFMDPLAAQGMIDFGSVTVVARSLVSVGVRAGSAKPDIGTVPAFKRAMLAAKSISYADPAQGGSGIQVARVPETLGIADAMKPKTRLVPGAESVDLVANGDAEMALANTPAIVARKGVELVAPIPSELYDTKDFAFKIGIGAKVQQTEAAKALTQYLSGPDASRVFKAKGVEPGPG